MDVSTVSGCAGGALISGPNRKFDGYFLTISVVCLESSELKPLHFIGGVDDAVLYRVFNHCVSFSFTQYRLFYSNDKAT